jgi:archaellum biogenesis ATPase FlaH
MAINPYTSAPLAIHQIIPLYTERGIEENILKHIKWKNEVEKQNIIIEGEKGIGKTTLLTKIHYQLTRENNRLILMYTMTQNTNYRSFLADVLKKNLEYVKNKGKLESSQEQLLLILQNESKLKYVNTGTLENYFLEKTTKDTVIIIDNANYILSNIPEIKNLFIAHGFTLKPVFILCFVDTDLTSFMEKDTMGFFDRFGSVLKVSKMNYEQVEDMVMKRLRWTDIDPNTKLEDFLTPNHLRDIFMYFQGYPRGIITVCRNLYDVFTAKGTVTDVDVAREMMAYQNKLNTRKILQLSNFKQEVVSAIYVCGDDATYNSIFNQVCTIDGKKRSKPNLSISLAELVASGVVTKIEKGVYNIADDIRHLLDEVGGVDKVAIYAKCDESEGLA